MNEGSAIGDVLETLCRIMFLATVPRRRDLIGHWSKPYANFQLSSLEFYASLAEILRSQQIPELLILRKRWKEGNLLSSRREYLRISYGRYSCDVCAAPFGVNYFFSCWTGFLPRKFTWRNLMGMSATCLLVLLLLANGLYGLIVNLLIMVGLLSLLRKWGMIQTQGQFDEVLSGFTIIGPIFDLLRRASYYEVDTAEAFHAMVQRCLMDLIDKVTEVHGLDPLTEKDRAPIMRELLLK